MKYLRRLKIKGKIMRFPVYFPDATRAVVRGLDSRDLQEAGIEGLILNPYHLLSHPGLKIIKAAGGIKNYMDWPGLAIADSGGWQLLSLVYKDPSFGRVTDEGVIFYKDSLGRRKKHLFTPEKSIQLQLDLEPDIIICLDDCPGRNAGRQEIEKAVWRTIAWAKRSKSEYEKQLPSPRLTTASNRPLLLAVVQGGHYRDLRKTCAQELIKIGFDGYGWGGWSIGQNNRLNLGIAQFIVQQLPPESLKFALGVGYPCDIINCVKLGYHIFDCVIPTRDARHGRLYVWSKNPNKINILKTNPRKLFDCFYPAKQKYATDSKPVGKFCDCLLCQNHSRAYLRHLFRIKDSLAWRLATIHNLRIYTKLIEILRQQHS